MSRLGLSLGASALVLLAALPNMAVAQDSGLDTDKAKGIERHVDPETGFQVIIFTAEFFKGVQVSTAADMVDRIPGFQFKDGSDVRGYAGAASNVIIDGHRQASKNSMAETLRIMNASQVDHIELIIGGAPGVDMQGHREVVNVVRKSGAKPSQTLAAAIRHFDGGDTMGAVRYSFSQNRGDSSLDFTILLDRFIDDGTINGERFTYVPTPALDTSPQHLIMRQGAGGYGSENSFRHARPLFGGRVTVSLAYSPTIYKYEGRYRDATDANEHLESKEYRSEGSVQFEKDLTPKWSMDFNLLHRGAHTKFFDVYTEAADVSRFSSLTDTSEDISSLKLKYKVNERLSLQFGAERAFNRLDSASVFTFNTSTQNVPLSVVRVEEDRTEYQTNLNWQFTPKLNVETAMRVETSTISVPQSGRSSDFVYTKPMIQAVYGVNDKMKLSWRSERALGQLNFNDFASSVSLLNNVIVAGNPDIVPQKEWRHTLKMDYGFWEKGNFGIRIMHADLEDVMDYVAIVTPTRVFNARGNIGEGTLNTFEISATIPTDRFKIKNGLFKFQVTYNQSEVTDPITGQKRALSNLNPMPYGISFRQTFSAWNSSWGFNISNLSRFTQYQATEITRVRNIPFVSVYADHKISGGVTFTGRLEFLGGLDAQNERVVYSGLRDSSPISFTERDHYKAGPNLYLHVKKEF